MNALTDQIIGAAIDVHRALGPGLLESVYQECLHYELGSRGLKVERQVELPVRYRELTLPKAFRLDLVVEGRVIVELKAIGQLEPIHRAQLLTYLRMTGISLGLLLNFNVPRLKDGIVRVVNGYSGPSPSRSLPLSSPLSLSASSSAPAPRPPRLRDESSSSSSSPEPAP